MKVANALHVENADTHCRIFHGPDMNLNDPEQRLFVVYRDLDGGTSVRRIFKKEPENGTEPLPLSEQFLRGYLGGLPDNF